MACTRRLSSADDSQARTTATGAASAKASSAPAPTRRTCWVDRRERQRHAHVGDLRVIARHGRVEHVALHGGAVPLDDADLALARELHFGALEMVVERRERLAVDASNRPSTRPSRAISVTRPSMACAEPVGFSSIAMAGHAWILREELGDEARLVAEPPLDERPLFAPRSSHAMMTVAMASAAAATPSEATKTFVRKRRFTSPRRPRACSRTVSR